MSKLRAYYELTKPGVLYGNVLSAAAGFLFASKGNIDHTLFMWLVVGTTLVIASACVLNNYLDQDIDARMARTKKRGALLAAVGQRSALVFSVLLGLVGICLLIAYTNWLVVLVGIIGFIDYVVLYGMLSKRRSIHGTLVGSISGAAPILAGYVAVSGAFDLGALLVFLVIFVWQMPEFYSISIYRRKEYAAANVPVMAVVKGVKSTKVQILAYTLAFVVCSLLLAVYGYAQSVTYVLVMVVLGVYWLYLSLMGLRVLDNEAWARKMFKFSLIILLAFCGIISVDAWLP